MPLPPIVSPFRGAWIYAIEPLSAALKDVGTRQSKRTRYIRLACLQAARR